MQSAAPRIWCAILWKNKFSLRIPTDFPVTMIASSKGEFVC
jgi:hypothetical protein